ncbi:hypothetical protein GW17_00017367 [Ensete ventricosum]|nr:hypothetical protein GW17_00017367 [Ensete ventricosum]RZR99279.1 hypothetical protein BHM03_00028794 [Ensete ventricosum]
MESGKLCLLIDITADVADLTVAPSGWRQGSLGIGGVTGRRCESIPTFVCVASVSPFRKIERQGLLLEKPLLSTGSRLGSTPVNGRERR